MSSKKKRTRKQIDPVAEFEALPTEEKERLWASLNREIPRSELRPLTPAEREQWQRVKRKMSGRHGTR